MAAPEKRASAIGALAMTAAMLAVAWLGSRRPSGPAEERAPSSLMALGEHLAGQTLVGGRDEVSRFRLDGIAVRALGGSSEAGFERVLDEASAQCARDRIDPFELAHAVQAPSSERATSQRARTVIEGRHGYTICLEPGTAAMRYVYASTAEDTRFVVVWTDHVVRYADLAPGASGEVGGDDVPDVPRPPGARRTFSFVREDGRDQYVIYDVRGVSLERWANEALPGAGWSAPIASGGETGERVLVATHGDRRVQLVLADERLVVLGTTVPSARDAD